jgi:hypothetical protein
MLLRVLFARRCAMQKPDVFPSGNQQEEERIEEPPDHEDWPKEFWEDFKRPEQRSRNPEDALQSLRGSVVDYIDPLEPVGLEDWEALR